MEIKEINEQYIRGVDKWNRMYAGLATSLKKYEDDIIHIKVENTEKVRPSNFEVAESIVKNWMGFSAELRQAKGWVVYFYKTNASTGFAMSFNALSDKDVIEKVVKQMSADPKLKLVNIYAGVL